MGVFAVSVRDFLGPSQTPEGFADALPGLADMVAHEDFRATRNALQIHLSEVVRQCLLYVGTTTADCHDMDPRNGNFSFVKHRDAGHFGPPF